jgi:hypothetical protein
VARCRVPKGFHNRVHRLNGVAGSSGELSTAHVRNPAVDFCNELLFLMQVAFSTEAVRSHSPPMRMPHFVLGLFSTIPQHLIFLLVAIQTVFSIERKGGMTGRQFFDKPEAADAV